MKQRWLQITKGICDLKSAGTAFNGTIVGDGRFFGLWQSHKKVELHPIPWDISLMLMQ